VNSLVNRSLRKFVDWDSHAERFGMVTLPPALFMKLMERQSAEEARELGRKTAQDSARYAVESIFADFTLVNLLEFLRRMGQYGGRFRFEDNMEGRRHVILIRHGMGLKWSSYYSGVLQGFLEDGLGVKIETQVSPEVCLARFEIQATSEHNRQ